MMSKSIARARQRCQRHDLVTERVLRLLPAFDPQVGSAQQNQLREHPHGQSQPDDRRHQANPTRGIPRQRMRNGYKDASHTVKEAHVLHTRDGDEVDIVSRGRSRHSNNAWSKSLNLFSANKLPDLRGIGLPDATLPPNVGKGEVSVDDARRRIKTRYFLVQPVPARGVQFGVFRGESRSHIG